MTSPGSTRTSSRGTYSTPSLRRGILPPQSTNPHWHIPRALESLEGEVEAARLVIGLWEGYSRWRLQGLGQRKGELGTATSAIVLSSMVAERALKTLHAHCLPTSAPPRTHALVEIYDEIDATTQSEVESQFRNMPNEWDGYDDNATVAAILQIADHNFVDWRYTMEPRSTGGGIPKPLLRVAAAVVMVCMRKQT